MDQSCRTSAESPELLQCAKIRYSYVKIVWRSVSKTKSATVGVAEGAPQALANASVFLVSLRLKMHSNNNYYNFELPRWAGFDSKPENR
jgi:hypothetical protein